MKRVFSIFLSCWIILASLGLAFRPVAASAEESLSEWGSITTSDRWKQHSQRLLRNNSGVAVGTTVALEDRYVRSDAYGLFVIADASVTKRPSAQQWVRDVYIPMFMKKFTGQYTGASFTDSEESTLMLSGGIPATVLERKILVNGFTRYVTFVSWETPKQGTTPTLYGMFIAYNYESTRQLSPNTDPMKELLGGIKLPHSP